MIIENGVGGSNLAQVDELHRLSTFAIVESEDKFVNKTGGQWSLYFTATPTGAGDYFFYLKNTDSVTHAISDIRIMGASADTITYEWVTGTPTYTGATDVTPTTRNGGSNKVPVSIIKSDPNITGLTSDGVIFFERLDTANKRYKLSTTSNIIMPQGSALAFKAATGTALITCVVSYTNLDD